MHEPVTGLTGGRRLPAAELPVGTVVVVPAAGGQMATKTGRFTRCPWRIGGPRSVRFAANWRIQEWINAGAAVIRPTYPTV